MGVRRMLKCLYARTGNIYEHTNTAHSVFCALWLHFIACTALERTAVAKQYGREQKQRPYTHSSSEMLWLRFNGGNCCSLVCVYCFCPRIYHKNPPTAEHMLLRVHTYACAKMRICSEVGVLFVLCFNGHLLRIQINTMRL